LRILTWNIHGGVGPDRSFNLGRVISLVQRYSPDIVALQEVDSRGGIPNRGLVFEQLAAALGPHSAEARLIVAADGDYGHVLMSRWPLSDTVRHDISLERRERRAAIETTASTPYGPLHLIAAHLGLRFRERQHQARLLRSLVDAAPARTVVLGDFNDWFFRGSVQKTLAMAMPARTHHKTFPAWRPILALDRIYCRPASLLANSWTDPAGRIASDHLPVIADLAPE
jgi:endonuclease/exonuclease/phosphatase family metal-dependent hydrolase